MTQKKIFVYHISSISPIRHVLWENSAPSVVKILHQIMTKINAKSKTRFEDKDYNFDPRSNHARTKQKDFIKE